MATESIFHNFSVDDPKAVKKILEALDWFEKQPKKRCNPRYRPVTDPRKIKKLIG